MLYPVPAVFVSAGDAKGRTNLFTVAWTGTICTNPAMVYISVRPQRYSYGLIKDSGEFVISLPTRSQTWALDYCGVRSGRDEDKFAACSLTPGKAKELSFAPLIQECPVNIECSVTKIEELGSHHMFLGLVRCVHVDESLLDEGGRLMLEKAGLVTYCHGRYMSLGQTEGTFGWSVRKKDKRKGKKQNGY